MKNRLDDLRTVEAVSRAVGRKVRLMPHDELLKSAVTDELISVLIKRVKAREYRYQTCFDSAELHLLVWRRSVSGWVADEPLVLPDPNFLPYRRQEIGEVRDRPEEKKERLAHEAMCHRPGNKSRFGGRDSFDRVWGDESPMERSWSEHKTVLFRSAAEES